MLTESSQGPLNAATIQQITLTTQTENYISIYKFILKIFPYVLSDKVHQYISHQLGITKVYGLPMLITKGTSLLYSLLLPSAQLSSTRPRVSRVFCRATSLGGNPESLDPAGAGVEPVPNACPILYCRGPLRALNEV